MGISGLVRGVRAKMSAAAPMAASLLRPAAAAAPRRRRWIVLVGCLVAATATFSALTQTPIIIANTAAAALFGVFDESDADQDSRPPNICAPIPTATPTTMAAPSDTSTPGATTAAPDALGPDGKPTPATMEVIKQIPVGADVDVAAAWILFRLAHPHDTRVADYKAFDDAYTSTRAAMSAQATPLDVVATMDPGANYAPYLLLAQAAAYRLLRQGTLSATDQQTRNLVTELAISCAGHEHAHELA